MTMMPISYEQMQYVRPYAMLANNNALQYLNPLVNALGRNPNDRDMNFLKYASPFSMLTDNNALQHLSPFAYSLGRNPTNRDMNFLTGVLPNISGMLGGRGVMSGGGVPSNGFGSGFFGKGLLGMSGVLQ